ncbi:MAG: sigma-70 family RNA polymerase sigma factor [Lysobacteraceae bacterium]
MQQVSTMSNIEQHAFGELLQSHRAIVFKVANTYCRHPEDRADLAQEIAAQLWSAWPGYDSTRRFSTWMYRIALNVAISFVRSDSRRQQRMQALDDTLHDVADENAFDHETDQNLRLLQAFIDRQSPIDRALLLLYMEEKSGRQIADILGISESNVSTKIGRLKQRIRDEI